MQLRAADSTNWLTFVETNRHFSFQYPDGWKINPKMHMQSHYTDVLVSLNSMGKKDFALKGEQTSPKGWEFGFRQITNQLPVGSAYMEVIWQEGPPAPHFGHGI